MNPRVGQRIIRDRWGEPIAPAQPNPKGPKPKRWLPRVFRWFWRNLRVGPEGPTQVDAEAARVVSDRAVMSGKQQDRIETKDKLCRTRRVI